MKKSKYKLLLLAMKNRWKHISKNKRFHKLRDNPAGTKFKRACHKLSRRAADGTMRS